MCFCFFHHIRNICLKEETTVFPYEELKDNRAIALQNDNTYLLKYMTEKSPSQAETTMWNILNVQRSTNIQYTYNKLQNTP